MANGRSLTGRRKHANRQNGGMTTCRNKLPRKSSPEGIKARQEIRAENTPKDTPDKKLTYIRPGSGNPRKVGR